MLKVKPFKQSKGYCGPASLKMVLTYYKINKSEKELAKLTKTSRIKGCKEENMIKLAKKLGLKGYFRQNSSIRALKLLIKNKIPIIVDWYSPEEEGHYSVVIGFKGSKIIIVDPHFGKIKKHNIGWFEERWFDIVNKKRINKEIIVITQ
jgi:ABC-type bacteriocin/lantibiotic exporter with double-glycine peptidase domain